MTTGGAETTPLLQQLILIVYEALGSGVSIDEINEVLVVIYNDWDYDEELDDA